MIFVKQSLTSPEFTIQRPTVYEQFLSMRYNNDNINNITYNKFSVLKPKVTIF